MSSPLLYREKAPFKSMSTREIEIKAGGPTRNQGKSWKIGTAEALGVCGVGNVIAVLLVEEPVFDGTR